MVNVICEHADGGIANYMDDTPHYFCGTDIPTVIFDLRLPQQNSELFEQV